MTTTGSNATNTAPRTTSTRAGEAPPDGLSAQLAYLIRVLKIPTIQPAPRDVLARRVI